MSTKTFRPFKRKQLQPERARAVHGAGADVLRRPLPEFELAPLSDFPVDVFNSDCPDVDAFILTLATAYNDLKSFEWNYQIMTDAAPTEMIIHPQVGQLYGMRVWATRFTIALMFELLLAIDRASSAGVTTHARFMRALALLTPEGRRRWERLERAATQSIDADESSLDDLVKWFAKVRNNLAYHYGQPKPLLQGYKRRFLDDPKEPSNEVLYASIGGNMAESRFYFADAASARAYDARDEHTKDLMARTTQMRAVVNGGLHAVVQAYLRHRVQELADVERRG